MSDWEVRVEGDKAIAELLAGYTGTALDAKLKRGLQARGKLLGKYIRQAAPENVKRGVRPGFGKASPARAGDLYRSIRSKTLRGSPPAVAVGPMSRYRHLAIATTKPHIISPLARSFLAIGSGGRFATVAHHPGNRAHPWVAAGIAAGRDESFEAAKKAIFRAVAKDRFAEVTE